jgi:hypothetical protein
MRLSLALLVPTLARSATLHAQTLCLGVVPAAGGVGGIRERIVC